ncbi:hypothetical protein CHS0354_013541 [Potamilus streckersoni]|uniref:Tyrosinase copper-binding domain-containing protein n=1 Tax=Potamilus streckersoni TaxID=2493646 RepID=A0AAE0T8E3_9BIVA|nr:hypothetical protein CHS0354_013541 [Potamilus streckersoni]
MKQEIHKGFNRFCLKMNIYGILLLLLSIWSSRSIARIMEIPLPPRMQQCFQDYSHRTSIRETVGESISWFCFDQYMWKAMRENQWMGFNITIQGYEWANGLAGFGFTQSTYRKKRQASLRVRKEYRRMTDEERNNFHRAIQMLKEDTSVFPNKYDVLASLHQGIITTSAHGGPNFLAFHRAYLLMFENALRDKISSVTVPYWDSTLDDAMINPTESVIWSPAFLGDGNGLVDTGPFARWQTMAGPLTRNIGQSGQLFRHEDIERIKAMVRLGQITEPNAPVNSSLEFHHSAVHIWVDGQMGTLSSASMDPVFWMHHAYVDYVWEEFRKNQYRYGVDPERDYPDVVNDTFHRADAQMGLGNLLNRDGLSNVFTSRYYTYEPSPSCSERIPTCGSRYLKCIVIQGTPRCVSETRAVAPVAMSDMAMSRNHQFISSERQSVTNSNGLSQFTQFPTMQVGVSGSSGQSTMSLQTLPQQQQLSPQSMFSPQSVMMMNRMMRMRNFLNGNWIQQESFQGMSDPRNQIMQKMQSSVPATTRMNMSTNQQISMSNIKKMPINSFRNHQIWMNNRGLLQTNQGNSDTMTSIMSPLANQGASTVGAGNIDSSSSVRIVPLFQNISSLPDQGLCPHIPLSRGYQNTYNLNGVSDISQWAYIPVKVIFQRPPTYVRYHSFPIKNGELDDAEDIYSVNSYATIKNIFVSGSPAAYSQCRTQDSGAGKVYIASKGINYMGTYKEYAVVDHRLAISIATAYVAVKSPERGVSEVFLSAYDSCGRICQPYCKTEGSGFRPCSGAIRVTSESPKMYGSTYGEAVSNLWQFGEGNSCPIMSDDGINISFHCNYRDAWPFGHVSQNMQSKMMSDQPAQGMEGAVNLGTGAQNGFGMKPIQGHGNQSGAKPETEPVDATNSYCNIGNGCVVAGKCGTCKDGAIYTCAGSCSFYTSCKNGSYIMMRCPANMWFDPDDARCTPGQCIDQTNKWLYPPPNFG